MDYSVTSAVPVWLGDHAIECHVLLQPGPASFSLESANEEGDTDAQSGSLDILDKLGLRNMHNIARFDEPMDVSYSLDDLKAEGIDLSQVIEIDFSKTNDAWMDVTTTSLVNSGVLVESFSHECEFCGKPFKRESKLKRHRQRFHAESKKSLKRNAENENENANKKKSLKTFDEKLSPTQCRFCRKNFTSTETRDRHLITFHKQKSITPTVGVICRVCQSACSSKAHLALHMLQNHSASRNVETELVRPDKPPAKTYLNVKSAVTSLARAFPCCLCDKVVYSRFHLEAHTRVHTQEKPLGKKEGFRCGAPSCRSLPSFKTNDHLLAHIESLHAFGCSVDSCTELFASQDLLERHVSDAHGSESCEQVDTNDDDDDEKEESFHAGASSPVLLKPLGRRMTEFVEKYFKKNKSSHGEVSCTYCRCDDTFKSVDELSKHFHEHHPFKCPKGCDKIWKFRSSIRKHIRSHHPDLLLAYHCDHCLDIFATRQELETHTLISHNQSMAKPKAGVSKQEKTESGIRLIEGMPKLSDAEKLFRCPRCDKSYQHPDSIRKHCRKDHKLLIISCRHCFIVFLTPEQKAKHLAQVHGCANNSPVSSPSKKLDGCSPPQKDPSTPKSVDASVSADSSSPMMTTSHKCPKCDRSYAIGKSLRKHCRLSHGLHSLIFCKMCEQVFENSREKDEHVLKDHSDQSFVDVTSEDTTLPSSPSSPEEFYGFATPTKEIDNLATKRRLSLSQF